MSKNDLTTENNTTFAMIPTWLLKSDISANAILLYGILWSYANRETGECFPSRTTLANDMSVSKDTVRRALRQLEEIGAVVVSQRDKGSTFQYTLIFSDPNTASNQATHRSNQGGSIKATSEVARKQPITITKEQEETNNSLQEVVFGNSAEMFTQKPDRKELWNALEQVMGYRPTSKSEQSNWGKVLKELVEINASPVDIKIRAQAYKKRWPNIDLTVNALMKHWDLILTKQSDDFSNRMNEIDTFIELEKGND